MKGKLLLLLLFLSVTAYSQEYAKSNVKKNKSGKQANSVEAIADNAMKEFERLKRIATEFLEQQEFSNAVNTYTQMLALNIKTGSVYQYRGTAHMLNKRDNEALTDFNAAIEHNAPDLPSIYFMRGMCRFNLQDSAGGCADIKQAKSLGAEVDESFFISICGKL